MADIAFSGVLDGTTINCELALTFENRSAGAVLVNYVATTYLNSSGYSQGGYEEYSAQINLKGSYVEEKTVSLILKPKSESWQGSQRHIKKGSFQLNLGHEGVIYPTLTYFVKSSASTKVLSQSISLTCPNFKSPAPPNPLFISLGANKLYYGREITLSWGSSAGAFGYKIYQSLNGGEFVLIGETEALSYTFIPLGDFGDKARFKVCPYNESLASGKVSEEISFGGGVYLKVSGRFTPCKAFVKEQGVWKRAVGVFINKNGSWVEGI